MAKSNLPSVDASVSNMSSDVKAMTDGTAKLAAVLCEVDGYLSRSMIDIKKRADTKLTTAQAMKLRDKIRELQDTNATLEDGSPITSKSDAIRWMIEQPLYAVR